MVDVMDVYDQVVQRSGRPNLAHRLQDELARKMAHQQSTGATHADLQSNRTEPTVRCHSLKTNCNEIERERNWL